ncbi:hypothetical protein [Amycolatopsis sp. NPDC049868]|uniref:hypothetical protein n=1 Tax=Amycolatopsis sp. NPDC049868 TaxID=3363934 RepID=UPI00378C0361
MSSQTTPADPAAAPEAGKPRSAAEHYAAAEALFARARAMHPKLSWYPADQNEYKRCFDWARMHLRLAEAVTAGAGLVLAYRHLLANPGARLHDTHVGAEARSWDEYLEGQHDPTGRPA